MSQRCASLFYFDFFSFRQIIHKLWRSVKCANEWWRHRNLCRTVGGDVDQRRQEFVTSDFRTCRRSHDSRQSSAWIFHWRPGGCHRPVLHPSTSVGEPVPPPGLIFRRRDTRKALPGDVHRPRPGRRRLATERAAAVRSLDQSAGWLTSPVKYLTPAPGRAALNSIVRWTRA